MAGAHVDADVAGDVRWFAGYGPLKVLGDCPHLSCRHHAQIVVAWGPDLTHYELVECMAPDGCNGRCRGWIDETSRTLPARCGPFRQVRR